MPGDNPLEEVFGEQFKEQMHQKAEESEGDDDIVLRMRSILECANRAMVDVEYVLANMDAEEHPDEFEMLEEAYKVFQQMQEEFQQDKYSQLTEREYEV